MIFDCDGVVLHTEKAWIESSKIFLSSRGINYKPEEIRHKLTGKILLDSTKLMQEYYHLRGKTEELAQERLELVKDIVSKHVEFVSGFLDFFNEVSKKYKISMATSIKQEIFDIADKQLGITALFKNHIYFGEQLKDASKPKPDIFLHAAKMTESEPQNCLVIEDAPNGIMAAKNAGMKCVALTTTFIRDLLTGADEIVDNFNQIDLSKF